MLSSTPGHCEAATELNSPALLRRRRLLFLAFVAATVVTFASVFLGTGTAARHRFGSQFLISTTSLVLVAASTAPLVSRYGLEGAAWALVVGAIVEFSAYVVLTFRDLKGAAAAVPGFVADALAGGIRP